MKARIIALSLAVSLGLPVAANALTLESYKDDLFAYPATLSEKNGGAYRVVDYQEMRDVNGRDVIPEKKAKPEYISLGVRSQQKTLKLDTPLGPQQFIAVGQQTGASVIVVYVHGRGGNMLQGANDQTFGGNFNRVKNLVASAGGLYLSPSFKSFDDKGAAQVAAIIDHFSSLSPDAPVIVACGSMGGAICWNLAQNQEIAGKLGGLALLGSHWDKDFLSSPAYKRKVPVFFGHGSRDPVFPVETQEAFYEKVRGKGGKYPTRFVRFETGNHGTPIRMVDWRDTLNWMLSR